MIHDGTCFVFLSASGVAVAVVLGANFVAVAAALIASK